LSNHGRGSSFCFLSHLAKTHRHPHRMHAKCDSIQSLISGVRLRHFLEHTPQNVARNLVPPRETQPIGLPC
jgi:hypothetical protein